MDERRSPCGSVAGGGVIRLCAMAAMVAWSGAADAAATGKGNGNGVTQAPASMRPRGGSDHIYYPDAARSFYDYQDSGAFAGRPMVIPPTVPILTQPLYLYVDQPGLDAGQAPPPALSSEGGAVQGAVRSEATVSGR